MQQNLYLGYFKSKKNNNGYFNIFANNVDNIYSSFIDKTNIKNIWKKDSLNLEHEFILSNVSEYKLYVGFFEKKDYIFDNSYKVYFNCISDNITNCKKLIKNEYDDNIDIRILNKYYLSKHYEYINNKKYKKILQEQIIELLEEKEYLNESGLQYDAINYTYNH